MRVRSCLVRTAFDGPLSKNCIHVQSRALQPWVNPPTAGRYGRRISWHPGAEGWVCIPGSETAPAGDDRDLCWVGAAAISSWQQALQHQRISALQGIGALSRAGRCKPAMSTPSARHGVAATLLADIQLTALQNGQLQTLQGALHGELAINRLPSYM